MRASSTVSTRAPWIEPVALAVAVAAGAVLRFWTVSDLWLDEALSVSIADLPLNKIPSALRHDGHPPLYYFLLHFWMQPFGHSDAAVRSLSGILALAALPLLWLAARRVGGTRIAWIAVGLLSLSPYAIRYATETRMYSLVIVLVLAGYLAVARAMESPTIGRLALVALVSGLLLLTHYWGLWLVTASAVLLLRRWRRVAVAVAAGGLLLLPWLGVMLDQSAHTGTPWADPVRPTTIVAETVHDFGGGDFGEGEVLGWLTVMLVLIGLAGRAVDRWHIELDLRTLPTVRREVTAVAATVALACVAGYVTDTTYATRYAAAVFPLVVLAAAVGLSRFSGRAVFGVTAGLLGVLGLISGVHVARQERTEAGVIAAAVTADAAPGDLVIVCPDQLGPAVHRLLPAGLQQASYPAFGDTAFVDWRDYAERNAAADPEAFADEAVRRARAGGATAVWLVFSGAYKTLEGQCEALAAALSDRSTGSVVRVAEDGDTYYEHASLVRFALV